MYRKYSHISFYLIIMGSLLFHSLSFAQIKSTSETEIIEYPYDNVKLLNNRISKTKIQSIALRTLGCYGNCPVLLAEFNNDGTATFEGEQYTKLIGKYKGKFSQWTFLEICDYIKLVKFEKLKRYYDYTDIITDLESDFIEICYMDGTAKSVHNFGHAAPATYHFLEAYLMNLIDYIEWEKVDE